MPPLVYWKAEWAIVYSRPKGAIAWLKNSKKKPHFCEKRGVAP